MNWLFGTNEYEFVDFEPKLGSNKGIMTLSKKTIPSLIEKLFGKKETTALIKFVGSGTVWHSFPDFVRQSIFKEKVLSEYWDRWKWEKTSQTFKGNFNG